MFVFHFSIVRWSHFSAAPTYFCHMDCGWPAIVSGREEIRVRIDLLN